MIRWFKTKGILIIFRVFVPPRYGVFNMSKLVIRDWFAINVLVLKIQDNKKHHGTKRALLETVENQE